VCGHALCLQGCAHPLHLTDRKSERGREGEKERERESEKERQRVRTRDRERERQRVRKRDRKREYLFLKRMTGALAPFSCLVI
jgi:hypothetical protein